MKLSTHELRARGLILAMGKARATRYHATPGFSPAVLRNRLLHKALAERLVTQPELLDRVRERLAQLRRINPHGQVHHEHWSELLDSPQYILLRKLTEDSEQADDLRRESPFTVLLDQDIRRRVFEQLGG